MDDADRADAEIERMKDEAMRNRRRTTLARVNRCYNCGESLPDGLFCDVECREDYEARDASRRRAGGA